MKLRLPRKTKKMLHSRLEVWSQSMEKRFRRYKKWVINRSKP